MIFWIISIVVLVSLYIGLNLYVVKRINKANYINSKQRNLHRKFIWFLPFIGPFMIRTYWKKHEYKPVKSRTKVDRKLEKGGFFESGIYMGAAGEDL